MARPTFGALALLLSVLVQGFLCKECTNVPSQLSSHTFRFELLSSKNKSWQESVFSSYKYLIPFEDSAQSSNLLINTMNELEEQTHFFAENELSHRAGENSPQYRESFLSDISLHKVRLEADSDYGKAQQTNLEYLLMLDVDSLVWSFRKTAGLDTPGSPYGGWEDPKTELRGHFVGHYMSASALMWASTHNETLLYKMQAVVNALYECQQKMRTGYLSAFPSELFDRFEAIQPVWAPYYTIHKIMAGLLDQYKLATNVQAYKMVIGMANYFYNRVQNVIMTYTIERHWLSLNEETGGMNDVLYSLYTLTGNKKHLLLAHLFDKPCFLGLLAIKADSISGFHSNTHIPVVIGSQMRYEVTGDPLYKEIGLFFMDIINSSHSYATGGTSASEFWSDPKRLGSTLETENEESCTTYNMLKVARTLFRWTKGIAYADYYERTLINGVLSIQRGSEPGVMIYMLPLGPGHSKSVSYHGWGTPFDSFWCCYGTGIESFSKLGDSIYFQEGGKYPILYVNQFISSSLTWDKAGLIIKQKVKSLFSWDPYLNISMEFIKLKGSEENNVESTVNIRIPFWTTIDGATATLNNEKLTLSGPGTFLTITRAWKTEDKLSLLLPVEIRTERIKDNRPQFASVKAIFFGPYLLAGMTQRDWDLGVNNKNSFSEWITAVPKSFSSQLFSFCQEVNISDSVVLDETTLFLSQSENGVFMESFLWSGTNNASSATFRIIKLVPQSRNIEFKEKEVASIMDFVGSEVYLEPFAFPGMLVSHNGADYPISIINRPQYILGDEEHCLATICSPQSAELDAIFKVLPGLDGVNSSVSFEASSLPNCFLYGTSSYQTGKAVELRCKSNATDPVFNYATSFNPTAGIATYHPISFVARGTDRSYLLAPLTVFRDESYTVYFNITS